MPFTLSSENKPLQFPDNTASLSFTLKGTPIINGTALTPLPNDPTRFNAGSYQIVRTTTGIYFDAPPPEAPTIIGLTLDPSGIRNLNQWAQKNHQNISVSGFRLASGHVLALRTPCESLLSHPYTIAPSGEIKLHPNHSVSFWPDDHLQLYFANTSLNAVLESARKNYDTQAPTYAKSPALPSLTVPIKGCPRM